MFHNPYPPPHIPERSTHQKSRFKRLRWLSLRRSLLQSPAEIEAQQYYYPTDTLVPHG